MPTTYDDIYETFLMNTDFDSEDLPQSEEMIYLFINKAIYHFNRYAKKYSNRLQQGAVCNDVSEDIGITLTEDELLIVSYIMAELIAQRIYTNYASLYATYAKEMGVTNFNASANHKKAIVDMYKEKYLSMIEDQLDSFVL